MKEDETPIAADGDPCASIVPPKGPGVDASARTTRLANWSIASSASEAVTQPARGGIAPDPGPEPDTSPPAPVQYIFQEQVGIGGMGEVWRALQVSLNRPVAVKRLRIRDEPPAEIALREIEFRQEALIAGLLEHPNIVPVHDLGADENGSPLLSMKLVEGKSWESLIRAEFLNMEAEDFYARHLPILLAMAQAVAFAHARGIVHRDLKPSQVMVGDYGEVMLTDWGLALCLADQLGGPTFIPTPGGLPTDSLPSPATASNPAGTPAMMAPEQTLPHALDIGPWTDVYLLGGTLYSLLTGAFPHMTGSTMESIKLAASGQVRHPKERCPGRVIPEALSRICLRALSPEPRNRYRDGAEFLDALREYLSGAADRARSRALVVEAEQIAASESSGYAELAHALALVEDAVRLWPLNPAAPELQEQCLGSQATMAIQEGDLRLAQLTIGRMAAGERRTGLQERWHSADHARRRAARERRVLRTSTLVLVLVLAAGGAWFTLELSKERTAALTSRDRAQTARARAEDLLSFMIGDMRDRLEPIGRIDVLDAVGEKAQEYLDSLDEDELDYEAMIQRVRTATQLGALSRMRGDLERGLELLSAEEETVRALLQGHPGDPRLLEVAGEIGANKGQLLFDQGSLDESQEAYRWAIKAYRALLAAQPGDARLTRALANAMRGLADPDTLRGKAAQGHHAYTEAAVLLRGLLERDPADLKAKEQLGVLQQRLSVATSTSRSVAEGLPEVLEGIALQRELVAADPRNTTWKSHLAESLLSAGSILQRSGRPAEALEHMLPARELARELVTFDPQNAKWMSDYFGAANFIALAYVDLGSIEEAEAILRDGLADAEAALTLDPTNAEWTRDTTAMRAALGKMLHDRAQYREAAALLVPAVNDMARVALSDPTYKQYRFLLNKHREKLQDLFGDLVLFGHYDEALQAARAVVSALEVLHEQEPDDPKHFQNLAEFRMLTASTLTDLGCDEQALQFLIPAEEAILRLAEQFPEDRSVIDSLAATYTVKGRLLRRKSDYEGAHEAFGKMKHYFMFGVESLNTPGQRILPLMLGASSLRLQAVAAIEMGDLDLAAGHISEAREILDEVGGYDPALLAQWGILLQMIPSGVISAEARVAKGRGDVEAAQRLNEEALAALGEGTEPRVLEMGIFVLIQLGRSEEAASLIAQQRAMGKIGWETELLIAREMPAYALADLTPPCP